MRKITILFLALLGCLCLNCRTIPEPTKNEPLLKVGNFKHIPGPNPAITVPDPSSKSGDKFWDSRCIESSDAFYDNGTYYWYYHGSGSKGYQIGVATSKNPLGPWKRYEGNPIVKVSKKPHESYCVACPMVVKDGDKYYMIYLSAGESPVGWGWSGSLAYADHPLGPWEKYEKNPILVHQHMGYPGGLVKVKGKWYMFGTEPDEVQPDYGRMYVTTADSLQGPWEVREKSALSEGPKGSWDEAGFSEFEVLYYDGMFYAFYGGSLFNDPPNNIYRR